MQKIKKIIIPVSVFILLILPVVSSAYNLGDPLVPDCTKIGDKCVWGWTELMTLVNNVITFILKYMVVPISAIMFAYAGFLLVTAGGEAAHARTKAKEIFTNAVIGLVIAAGAWLIISTLLAILGYEGSWIGLYIQL